MVLALQMALPYVQTILILMLMLSLRVWIKMETYDLIKKNMNIEKFLKDKNIVRNKKQANMVMIFFIILCIIVIIMISRKPRYNNVNDREKLSPEEIELMNIGDSELNSLNNIDINNIQKKNR